MRLIYHLGMPTIEHFAPGEFCWVEVAASDQTAAKSFYGALFGWTAKDVPIGENDFYSLMELQGRVAAGAYSMRQDERAAGLPSHWKLYVAVANAEEAVKKSAQLGGKVIDAPFKIGDRGTAAVIQDPTGAVLFLWQGDKRPGIGVTGEPGAFCWADLNTPDQQRAKTFYEGLFGWKLEPGQGKESGYLHIVNGENYIGGVPQAEPGSAHHPPHWLVYFAVSDVDKTFQVATEMNASSLLGPVDFEGVGRVAIVADPQGAVFALFREAQRS